MSVKVTGIGPADPMRRARLAVVWAVLTALALLAMACSGGSATDRHPVSTHVLTDPSTQEVLISAPADAGSWPVVFLLHGINGRADDMAELSRRLAERGVVVFAPTYRTDLSSESGKVQLVRDAECGYRLARSVAAEYGGDLDKPVAFVGWSLGATFAIQGGLDEQIDPTRQYLSCFAEVPRADVIVALSGCYYEFAGNPSNLFSPEEWTNPRPTITLVAGSDDRVCAPWQSEKAATQLRSHGYRARVVTIDGATHAAPVFHTIVADRMVLRAQDPAGEQTLEVIIDAIDIAAQRR